MKEETVYTVKEVSELLKIRDAQVRNLLRLGIIKGFKVGKYWRVAKKEIDKLVEGVNNPAPDLVGTLKKQGKDRGTERKYNTAVEIEKAYTSREVAEILMIPESQIRKLIRRGYLNGFKEGRNWKIPESEVKKFTEGVLCSIDWRKELLAKLIR